MREKSILVPCAFSVAFKIAFTKFIGFGHSFITMEILIYRFVVGQLSESKNYNDQDSDRCVLFHSVSVFFIQDYSEHASQFSM